jgi:hypothetical protein
LFREPGGWFTATAVEQLQHKQAGDNAVVRHDLYLDRFYSYLL